MEKIEIEITFTCGHKYEGIITPSEDGKYHINENILMCPPCTFNKKHGLSIGGINELD